MATAKLLIIESPGKIKKISSYLGGDYIVKASMGSVVDLPKDKLAVDVANGFTPVYEVMEGKKGVVAELKKLAKAASEVVIATDNDREGEAIGYHLVNVLKPKAYKRILFNEITKPALLAALADAGRLDMAMVHAQQARRILDRLVGYKLSPVLPVSSSAGRVQSVTVRLLVDKEREIEEALADPRKRMTLEMTFKPSAGLPFKHASYYWPVADLPRCAGLPSPIDTAEKLALTMELIRAHPVFRVRSVGIKPRRSSPPAPYTTSTLQQDASAKLHLSVKATMQLAQKLYEAGRITYMRTDSPALSQTALDDIKAQVLAMFGAGAHQMRSYAARKAAHAQEAHEAIRPTKMSDAPLTDGAGSPAEKLYALIWRRTMACQMVDAEFSDGTVIIGNEVGVAFAGACSRLVKPGYLAAWGMTPDAEDAMPAVGAVTPWQSVRGGEEFACPPSRYSEATLVKKLEQLGIGRPSTYAATLAKIQDGGRGKEPQATIANVAGREMRVLALVLESRRLDEGLKASVASQVIGRESKRIVPTEVGAKAVGFLVERFPQVMDYGFTCRMEAKLDEVAHGKRDWVDVLRGFWSVFEPQLLTVLRSQPAADGRELVGVHPTLKHEIYYMYTKYGPALLMDGKFVSVGVKVSLERAVVLFQHKHKLGL